jgi:hypothetical protein
VITAQPDILQIDKGSELRLGGTGVRFVIGAFTMRKTLARKVKNTILWTRQIYLKLQQASR